MTRTRSLLRVLIAALAVVLLAFGLTPVTLDQVTLWTIEGILALSLVLVWGHGGIFSLGQTAMYGVGAYAFGVVAVNLGLAAGNPLIVGLLVAVALAAVLSGAVGYMMFYGRVSEVNIGIVTLALTLVLYALTNSMADPKYHIGSAELGGFNGLVGIGLPTIFGTVLDGRDLYLLVGGIAVAALAFVWWLQVQPFGRIAAAIRTSELRAELLGYDVRARRLGLFVLGGCLAGLAGALFATWGQFVSPTVFSLKAAILVVIWVLVGSRTSPVGAFLGVFVVEGLTSWLGGGEAQYAPIYLGVILIIGVVLLPNGLVETGRNLTQLLLTTRRIERAPKSVATTLVDPGSGPAPDLPQEVLPPDPAVKVMPAALQRHSDSPRHELEIRDLSKSYGAVTVVDKVSLELPARGVHVLIGPNGAGKSTLFGLVNGTAPADHQGSVKLGKVELGRLSPHQRARAGIGTKRQVVSIFDALPVVENLWVAAFAPRARRSSREAARTAEELVEWLGLDGETIAGTLSHGDQQRLEVAMVVAAGAEVVLLDEPTAGMTVAQAADMAELVHFLAEDCCVVVIDHDMGFVRQLEADVTVMHLGKVLMSGRLDVLETDEQLLDIYLGRHHAEN